jgi:hypothetical protein
MANRDTVRPIPSQLPSRQATAVRQAPAAADDRVRQLTKIQPLEPHWDAAIDAATD